MFPNELPLCAKRPAKLPAGKLRHTLRRAERAQGKKRGPYGDEHSQPERQNLGSFGFFLVAQLMLDNCWPRIYTHSQSLQAASNFGVVS